MLRITSCSRVSAAAGFQEHVTYRQKQTFENALNQPKKPAHRCRLETMLAVYVYFYPCLSVARYDIISKASCSWNSFAVNLCNFGLDNAEATTHKTKFLSDCDCFTSPEVIMKDIKSPWIPFTSTCSCDSDLVQSKSKPHFSDSTDLTVQPPCLQCSVTNEIAACSISWFVSVLVQQRLNCVLLEQKQLFPAHSQKPYQFFLALSSNCGIERNHPFFTLGFVNKPAESSLLSFRTSRIKSTTYRQHYPSRSIHYISKDFN